QASRSSSMACCRLPWGGASSSGNSPASWARVSGCGAASRAASTICRIRLGSMARAFSVVGRFGAVRGRFGEGGFTLFAGGGRQRLDVDRRQRRLLHDLDQLLLGELEDREEGDHHAEAAFFRGEQGLEGVELLVREPA